MINSDNGMRFTNDNYATRSDVEKALGTTIVDKIWKEIVDYRSSFAVNISLKSVDGGRYSICLAPAIVNKINEIERKLNKLVLKFSRLNEGQGKDQFIVSNLSNSLKTIANNLHINIDDASIKILACNNISALSPDTIFVQRYASILNSLLHEDSLAHIDAPIDFIQAVVQQLFGENTTLYRTKNNSTSGIYSNIYNEAPSLMIEGMMNELFDFLVESDRSTILKTIIIIYYLIYIKPFEFYNEEIAILTAKQFLFNADIGGVSAILDFEFICNDSKELTTVINETQKTSDLTYFLMYFFKRFDENLSKLLDDVVKAEADNLKSDYYRPETPKVDAKAEVLQSTENAKNETAKETIEVEKAIETPSDETKGSENQIENDDSEGITIVRKSAITNLTTGYSEEKAKQVEDYLIASNPNLTQSQAYFYARHCTLGSFYTIAQYKRFVGCAYETARTSMDKLVNEGYYSKEGYKNKFLYTPIRRK